MTTPRPNANDLFPAHSPAADDAYMHTPSQPSLWVPTFLPPRVQQNRTFWLSNATGKTPYLKVDTPARRKRSKKREGSSNTNTNPTAQKRVYVPSARDRADFARCYAEACARFAWMNTLAAQAQAGVPFHVNGPVPIPFAYLGYGGSPPQHLGIPTPVENRPLTEAEIDDLACALVDVFETWIAARAIVAWIAAGSEDSSTLSTGAEAQSGVELSMSALSLAPGHGTADSTMTAFDIQASPPTSHTTPETAALATITNDTEIAPARRRSRADLNLISEPSLGMRKPGGVKRSFSEAELDGADDDEGSRRGASRVCQGV